MPETGSPELFGGVACLDFANTLDGRATQHPEGYLHTYADLLRWAVHAGLLDTATARRLATTAAVAAEATLRTALDLREAIFRAFAAVGRDGQATEPDLAVVQRGYAAAMAAGRLAPDGAGFDWEFSDDDPDRAWWPVAVSAARLLTTGPLERVKVCAAEAGCIGLFLDTSKNHSRRWCSMDACGVEAKVQRQATRRRAARAAG
jgi:predicted RNA-binding Zn ribbon-like protein